MPKISLPPIEFLRECFSYEPATGVVRWNARPDHHFRKPETAARWREQRAGAAVGFPAGHGYLEVGVRYRGQDLRLKVHRIAFALAENRTNFGELDHADRNRTNNRQANLREATSGQNKANRAGWSKRGLPKGVSLNGKCYDAVGYAGGKRVYLGRFATVEEAHTAYCAYSKVAHGSFFYPGPSRPSIWD